jgi:hypothetical protein
MRDILLVVFVLVICLLVGAVATSERRITFRRYPPTDLVPRGREKEK